MLLLLVDYLFTLARELGVRGEFHFLNRLLLKVIVVEDYVLLVQVVLEVIVQILVIVLLW